MSLKFPRRRGAPYTFHEVELLYLVRKSRENAELLAEELERTAGAIEFAWRWMDADLEGFPPKAFNSLYRLICRVRGKNGAEARGRANCPTDARRMGRGETG